MRLPGVIGGLGPQTTSDYYLYIQKMAHQRMYRTRPPMLIWSVPLPYDLEKRSIFQGEGFNEIGVYLEDAARYLERGGADFIVMPCNTLHLLTNRIRQSIAIPFVSIIDETINVIKYKGYTRVALLATGPTIQSKLYEVPLKEAGIEVVKPSDEQQQRLNSMVVRLINDQKEDGDIKAFQLVLESLSRRGAQIALLACTDFHILFNDYHGDLESIDTMEILAQATMRESETKR